MLIHLHPHRRKWRRIPLLALGTMALLGSRAHADEQLFGFARGAETLPKNRSEFYQFLTFRTVKSQGDYYGFDFESEVEHGFTDKFQASLALTQHYFNNSNVNGDRDALDDTNAYRFGGLAVSGKYRFLSPFKDPLGLALRLESGYLWHDEVGGLKQHEFYLAPELELQKNFRDDTIVWVTDLGVEWAWGKDPAEEYPREFSLEGATGVSYRFAPNWFIGVEANVRSEYPLFDFDNFEHVVVYAGPSLHYSAKNWWVTLTCTPQVWGDGVDEPNDGQTYAEETALKVRLKFGVNF